MKSFVFTLLALVPFLNAHGEETEYQKELQSLWDRFATLDTERADYRKPRPKLTAAQEEEWLRLRGQLLRDDPIFTVCEHLQMDLEALKALPSPTDRDKELIETFKELLAIVGSCRDRTATLAEATACATTLRQFIARRDSQGAIQWLKAKFPDSK